MARSERELREMQRRFGARLRVLRERRGLTQQALADAADLSQKYVSELERGAKAPSFDTMVLLAHRVFKISLAALVFDLDADRPTPTSHVDDLLAGRSDQVRREILDAVARLLRAGAGA